MTFIRKSHDNAVIGKRPQLLDQAIVQLTLPFTGEEGTIEVELHEGLTSVILGVKELPGMRRYWRQRRSYLHSEFAEYVDQLLTQEADVSVDIYRIPEANPEHE